MFGMGRGYRGVFEEIAVTAAQDLFELLAPTDALVIVTRIVLYQTSDVGDAAEEILDIRKVRGIGSVTSGSGGGTVTMQPLEDGHAAFGGTLERNNTTKMVVGSGTLETVGRPAGWNVRQSSELILTPEELDIISPGNRLTVELVNAPADSLTMSGEITCFEIGG